MLKFFYELDFRDYGLESNRSGIKALVEGTQDYLWDKAGLVSSRNPNAQFDISLTEDTRRARAIIALRAKNGNQEGLDCAFLDFIDNAGAPTGVLTSVEDPILTNALWNRGVDVEIDNLAGTRYWKVIPRQK
jgi:hypothetical protein